MELIQRIVAYGLERLHGVQPDLYELKGTERRKA